MAVEHANPGSPTARCCTLVGRASLSRLQACFLAPVLPQPDGCLLPASLQPFGSGAGGLSRTDGTCLPGEPSLPSKPNAGGSRTLGRCGGVGQAVHGTPCGQRPAAAGEASLRAAAAGLAGPCMVAGSLIVTTKTGRGAEPRLNLLALSPGKPNATPRSCSGSARRHRPALGQPGPTPSFSHRQHRARPRCKAPACHHAHRLRPSAVQLQPASAIVHQLSGRHERTLSKREQYGQKPAGPRRDHQVRRIENC